MSVSAVREDMGDYWGISSFTMLLDTYPNAAVAYSFRKLRAAYAGSAIRLRRASDDAEIDVGFLPTGAFDVFTAATHIAATTGHIVTWYDQSGNADNATQATEAQQPTYSASPLAAVFTTAGFTFMDINAAYDPSGGTFTLSASVQIALAATGRGIIGARWQAGQVCWRVDAAETHSLIKENVALVGTSGTALATGTPQYIATTYDGTNFAFYLQGAADGTGSNAQTFVADQISLGRAFQGGDIFDGHMFEFVAWPTEFASGDITNAYNKFYA